MKNIKNTTKIVNAILESERRARNSDAFLYLRVLETIAEENGMHLDEITVSDFLLNLHGSAFPPYISVGRARRKLQEKRPDLAPSEAVAEYRAENEQIVRQYAKG